MTLMAHQKPCGNPFCEICSNSIPEEFASPKTHPMTGWPKTEWVIIRNGGCEGYDILKMVFSTKEEADQVLKIPVGWGSLEVHEMPFWIPIAPPEDKPDG